MLQISHIAQPVLVLNVLHIRFLVILGDYVPLEELNNVAGKREIWASLLQKMYAWIDGWMDGGMDGLGIRGHTGADDL